MLADKNLIYLVLCKVHNYPMIKLCTLSGLLEYFLIKKLKYSIRPYKFGGFFDITDARHTITKIMGSENI